MEDVTLQQLLEAGCHFGHKAERWHPKAAEFIYTKKDGVHIIDLAKTKAGLDAAIGYIRDLVAGGGEVLFVGTKRQAQGIVTQEAKKAGAPYLTARWIGGFLTNWDNIHKNIEKINRMTEEQATGAWKKFPKHEQTKMGRYVNRIRVYYDGVLHLDKAPDALFIVDVRKEVAALREGKRRGFPVIAVVDTNTNPEDVDYAIPANDDAVGSISLIVATIAAAYKEGKDLQAKGAEIENKKLEAKKQAEDKKAEPKEETAQAASVKPDSSEPKEEKVDEVKKEEQKKASAKRGRPKKAS